MLAIQTLTNQELTVYTVPAGKKAYVFLDLFPVSSGGLSVKINNTLYFSKEELSEPISFKLFLTSGDRISVAYTGTCNIFIHGEEV
jgi:hypothetical protein